MRLAPHPVEYLQGFGIAEILLIDGGPTTVLTEVVGRSDQFQEVFSMRFDITLLYQRTERLIV